MFILIALHRFPYVPYLLPIEVEALTVYHSSGIPVYHRTLREVVTHDPALLSGALSAINSFTSEVVSGSSLNSIQAGPYILENYRMGEYTVLLVSLSRNNVVDRVLSLFIRQVDEVLTGVDPSGPKATGLVEDLFRSEMPILQEMAPPVRV